MNHLTNLYSLLDHKTKRKLIWLIIFSIFLSIIETIGISAIMPFIDIATNFENIKTNQYYQSVFNFFNFDSKINFAIGFGLLLIVFYIFRGVINLLYTYLMSKFSEEFYAQTIKKLFKVYLQMPYLSFTTQNSSYLTKTIITEASLMSTVMKGILLAISEVFVVAFIYILMIVVNWKITILFTGILLIKLFLLKETVFKATKKVGIVRAKTHAEIYETVNRFFGNFKSIKLLDMKRLEKTKVNFSLIVNKYSKSNIMHNLLNALPRLILETGGFVLVILLLVAILYLNQTNISNFLPTLSLLVLALFRLMPSINRILTGYNTLMFHHRAIEIIAENLNISQEHFENKEIAFTKKITLKNVCFSYGGKKILSDINLSINKGQKIAFIGDSGSGKTTLLDIIIGLQSPDIGEINIDQTPLGKNNLQNWRSQIGYISQQIYLFDGTIEENVCFGRDVDETLLEKVLKQANIYNFLQAKQGLDTLVGEGGIQLSGGQKQRIAIARALYGCPEIIVLDEATSALDSETERNIMKEIYQISEDKTLFIVAHRLSTLEGCDIVWEIKNQKIRKINL